MDERHYTEGEVVTFTSPITTKSFTIPSNFPEGVFHVTLMQDDNEGHYHEI